MIAFACFQTGKGVCVEATTYGKIYLVEQFARFGIDADAPEVGVIDAVDGEVPNQAEVLGGFANELVHQLNLDVVCRPGFAFEAMLHRARAFDESCLPVEREFEV